MSNYKRFFAVLFLLFSMTLFSQDYSDLWEGHFSYLNIGDVTSNGNMIYAASENSVFSFDSQTQEIETLTTIDGLSGETISAIHYSQDYGLLLIGYANGLIEISSDISTKITSVIDILNKETIPSTKKKINHFFEDHGVVYISTDYGISVFNLERLEFGDSYFIGFGSSQIKVNQTTVIGDYIYAACGNNGALKKALKTNPSLIDYTQWITMDSGDFLGISNVNDNLFAVKSNRRIYKITNDILTEQYEYPTLPKSIKSSNGHLVITTSSQVFVYDDHFNLVVAAEDNSDAPFTCATVNLQNAIFIGTTSNVSLGKPGLGILKTTAQNSSSFEKIHPPGPLMNTIFSIKTPPNEIWAVFGGYSSTFNFNGGIARTGISHYKNEAWKNTPYDTIAASIPNPNYLSHIAVNPFNPDQVFISSYWSGLIEFNQGNAVGLYDQTNSTIMPFLDDLHLTLGSTYDRQGALWVMDGRVAKPLNKFENGKWTAYDFTPIIEVPTSNIGFTAPVFDAHGNVFIGSFLKGLIGYNFKSTANSIKFIASEENNMPSDNVKALAIDLNNQLWIGTIYGLRVLYNTDSFFSNSNISVREIVIMDDGIPKELLSGQVITDIEVDGSNNKWIGTGQSGVFYFSPDGQQTIHHFTTNNSPLPSNTINDISIDSQTGKVYIATSNGLVSFNSGGSNTESELNSAFVYPNPVRPEYNVLGADNLNDITKGVKIKGITENVNIKITDIEGNLVAEAQSRVNLRASRSNYNFAIDGGTAVWNGKNLANNVVASGVYLIMISDLDTFETKVLKLMIIR
ncbi:MAG TPA: hypothetical protein VNJ50_07450 [Gelidibacter sp.]|uniref:type IX secretion system anionic LPS delivery protein PorZ n=1 Tax=Gelidibacter sp. TaxID=2018083 RepID=UPI002C2C59A9|nr:ABC transporter substrate-binding protein [Gelidibacter sp.]HXJ98666.1 hypothetical protein [Gelidibacter sp.]